MDGPERKECLGILDPEYDFVTSESASVLLPSSLSCQDFPLKTSVRQTSPGRSLRMCAFDTHPPSVDLAGIADSGAHVWTELYFVEAEP